MLADGRSDPEARKVRYRFWLITSLIVAFVAASWAFGIRLTPAPDAQPAFGQIAPKLGVLDDDGRGR